MPDVNTALPGTDTQSLIQQLMATNKDSQANIQGAAKQIEESRARETAARQAQTAAMAPKQAELKTALSAAPTPPEPKALPEAPQAPQFDSAQMGETLSLITALAAMGGLLTRAPLTAALDNFSAGVHGFVQGNQQVFQNSMKQFDENLKKAESENASIWKKYQAAKEKHGVDIAALQQELKVIAAETQSPIDLELAKRGDVVSLMKLHEQTNANFEKTLAQVGRMQETAAQHAETKRHNQATEALAAKKAGEGAVAGKFDENDVKYWAEVMQKGGSLPPRLATTPGGKQLVADIMKYVTKGGVAPAEMLTNQAELMGLKAGERTAGTKSANIEMAVNEAHNMQKIVLDTSAKFARTEFQPINKALKSFQDNTGSVESRQFGAALNSFINAYARAISPSGVPTVSDKEHAREMLSTADSHKQVEAIMSTLNAEMEAARKSPGQVREAMREGMTRRAGDQPKSFATEQEAAAAGLAPGTKVTIGGVPGTWQ